MPKSARSLISIDDLSVQEANDILGKAAILRDNDKTWTTYVRFYDVKPVVASCFFEPSTRTRLSFEMVCSRLGLPHIDLGEPTKSSVAKGETLADTFLNVSAMNPDLIIVRYKFDDRLDEVIKKSNIPVISAGQGINSHPTQALLDAFTIQEKFSTFKDIKVVYCGDVAHSRVAASGQTLLRKLGAKVAFCAPEGFVGERDSDIEHFSSLQAAAEWADVVIGLRVQKERHSEDGLSKHKSFEPFRLDKQSLKNLSDNAIIMHPGPFEPMVDLHPELLEDPRCRIHRQVTNGVYVRAALLTTMLDLWRRDL